MICSDDKDEVEGSFKQYKFHFYLVEKAELRVLHSKNQKTYNRYEGRSPIIKRLSKFVLIGRIQIKNTLNEWQQRMGFEFYLSSFPTALTVSYDDKDPVMLLTQSSSPVQHIIG